MSKVGSAVQSNEINTINDEAFVVTKAGMLSLLQDSGRYGQSGLGLTHGGPSDSRAFAWANRLLGNQTNATAIEITIGGFALKANIDTQVCITGADMAFSINSEKKKPWCTHKVNKGDVLELGFASSGVKAYLAVAGGFIVPQQFGSTSTVVREKVGGLSGAGLSVGDCIPATEFAQSELCQVQRYLTHDSIPKYDNEIRLRVVLGYQEASFSHFEQVKFFNAEYQVSKQWDRMGYRLEGQAIVSTQSAMLSEGIALGAIQIPPDGQPIILMHDRQTIGGYPKIGSVFSLDIAKLAQCGQGAKIRFEPMNIDDAHNALMLEKYRYDHTSVIDSNW